MDLGDRSHDEIKKSLDSHRAPIDVAVYSIENYFNLGGIIRLCHNFAVRRVIAIDLPKHYKKADMGTRKYENIKRVTLGEFLDIDPTIVAFEARDGLASRDIRTYTYPENPCLFFGSEKNGVPEQILERAAGIVAIPVFGVHNDHNVNIAAAMVLYDFMFKHPQYYSSRVFGELPINNAPVV